MTQDLDTPRPYLPPDIATTASHDRSPTRPWMAPRPGESESERIDRLHRTCFHCGHQFTEVAETTEHELACGG